MKKIIVLLLFSSLAIADEFIQFSNGATAFRNENGFVYGYNGGSHTGSGFNDVRTGERYENINPSQSINTHNGQVMQRPNDGYQYDSRGYRDE
jgi:hypothetical protein